jgi:hypothetical protein
MEPWKILWTLVWFGGLALFAVLSVIITVQGARDLKALLRGLRDEPRQPQDRESR